MVKRSFWLQRIQQAWRHVPIVWLSGVRRVGKTTLARSLPNIHYLNCDLPSTHELLRDPESFFGSITTPVVVLDEIHQLPDPSRILKIAADAYSHLKILATGSSTLAATQKFRDSLTGRKRTIHLVPVLIQELPEFGIPDLRKRLFQGGLPQALLAPAKDADFYAEWLDSYYARDVQELFRVEKRSGFLLLVEAVLRQSGCLFEVSSLAKMCQLSRPTVLNYLEVLQLTHVLYLLRPYHQGGSQELVRQPKLYGFDTGFVSHIRGWGELRSEDCGILWEHLVLEHLLATFAPSKIFFWRDKQQHEVDFVTPEGRNACHAIECKWNVDRFDAANLVAFRSFYPKGKNFVVAPNVPHRYTRTIKGMQITYTHPTELIFGSLQAGLLGNSKE